MGKCSRRKCSRRKFSRRKFSRRKFSRRKFSRRKFSRRKFSRRKFSRRKEDKGIDTGIHEASSHLPIHARTRTNAHTQYDLLIVFSSSEKFIRRGIFFVRGNLFVGEHFHHFSGTIFSPYILLYIYFIFHITGYG